MYDIHLDARPEGGRGPVVPCIDDACANMFALRGDLFGIRSFLDVDGELLISPAQDDEVSLLFLKRRDVSLTWYAQYHAQQQTYLQLVADKPRDARFRYVVKVSAQVEFVGSFEGVVVTPGNHETISPSSPTPRKPNELGRR